MRTRLALALLVAVACWITAAHAQKATERYVPIGGSPGLSGVSTVMGTVDAVDAENRRVTLRSAGGPRQVEIDDATRIWLDRTALGESNLGADLSDCRAGLTVEVKLDAKGLVAEWLKIRAPASP